MSTTYTYYCNGEQVTRARALAVVKFQAAMQGYEPENWEHAFRSPSTEERREFLNEISGYQLEIVASA